MTAIPDTPPGSDTVRDARSDAPGALAVVLAGALFLVLWQIAPRVPADGIGAIIVSTLLSLGILVWFSSALARLLVDRRTLLIHVAASAILLIPLRLMFAFRTPMIPWVFLALVPGLPDLLLVWFGCSVGGALARLLRGANMVPPVAGVLALVDIWTVLLGGPVGRVIESNAPAARAVTQAMTVPLPTTGAGAAPMAVFVGFADFMFIAFFVSAMCRFAPGPATYRRSVVALVVALCAYMALVMFSDRIPFLASWPGLPALLPMALVMIAVHWRQFHYERSEVFALLYAAGFIALIVGAFMYFQPHTTAAR